MIEKQGRPRVYRFYDGGTPLSKEKVILLLSELRARVEDQIEDLDAPLLEKPFSEENLTMGWLFYHLNWAELAWLPDLTGENPDSTAAGLFEDGKIGRTPSGRGLDGKALADLSRRHFDRFVRPSLERAVMDFDRQAHSDPNLTAGQICLHLFWHWSYHSGQIGLLRLMGGRDYRWSFE